MSSTLANISYNSIAKILTMGVQLATTTILARTLGSNDYGVIGVAMIVIGFLTRFDDIGMTAALVQRRVTDQRVLGTAQALNLALAVILFLAAQVAAPFTAQMFKNDAVPMVVRVLGFTFLISAAGFLPTALLTRNMEFARLRGPAVAGSIARGIVAVTLALMGAKHWSLVGGVLAGTLVTSILLRSVVPARAPWRLDRQFARELMAYGLPLWGAGLLAFVVLNTDNFFIGSLKGTSELGYYTVAMTWSTFVCGALSEVVHSVLFPRFSQLQCDRDDLAEKYMRSVRATVFVAFLANAALCAAADSFLFVVLGKGTARWLPSLAPLQILCVYGALRASIEPVGSVAMALGRSRVMLWATIVPAALEICALPFAVITWGLPGVAALMSLAYGLQWLVYGPFLVRELRFSTAKLFQVAVPGIAGAVVAVAVSRAIPLDNPLLWSSLFIRLAVASATFAVVHELISRGSILGEVALIVSRLKQGRGALASA